jgi:hexosaminidase
MARESGPFGHGRPTKFRGMALTGWSRYDHFAVLCELLPVAYPTISYKYL